MWRSIGELGVDTAQKLNDLLLILLLVSFIIITTELPTMLDPGVGTSQA